MIRFQSWINDILRLIKVLIACWKNGKKVYIDISCSVAFKSSFEGANQLHQNVSFCGTMGYGSYIARNSSIIADIGKFTSIGPYVRVITGRHPYTYPYVSTSPMFFSVTNYSEQSGATFATEQVFDEERFAIKKSKRAVFIGSDCWIGADVKMISGIRVNDGAVVLAGAVVTKDVPPYAIVGGVPAKVVKYRYDENTIKFLLDIKWWNLDKDWLRQNWKLLCNIDQMKECFMEKQNE